LVIGDFYLSASSSIAQNIVVKGQILKQDGQPVSRASVLIKGTKTGTTSDDNGNFQISAAPNSTLVISAVDYETKEINIGNQSSVNVTLTALDKAMGEVVVIGYTTQRKRDVTGSTVSVKGETLNEIKAPNILISYRAGRPVLTLLATALKLDQADKSGFGVTVLLQVIIIH
jgi:hypothetical protein